MSASTSPSRITAEARSRTLTRFSAFFASPRDTRLLKSARRKSPSPSRCRALYLAGCGQPANQRTRRQARRLRRRVQNHVRPLRPLDRGPFVFTGKPRENLDAPRGNAAMPASRSTSTPVRTVASPGKSVRPQRPADTAHREPTRGETPGQRAIASRHRIRRPGATRRDCWLRGTASRDRRRRARRLLGQRDDLD